MHMIVQVLAVMAILVHWNFVESRGLPVFNQTGSSNHTNGTKPRAFCVGIGAEFWGGCAEDMLNSGSGCLAGDDLVQLASGLLKTISNLQAGDRVLAMNEHESGTIVETEIIMIMHRVPEKYAVFYVVETENHEIIHVTPGHFVPVLGTDGGRNYVQAQTLTMDDYIFVRSETTGHLSPSKVASITVEVKIGYYSPLTMTGTLIVNNVAVSCFSNILSHEMGQLGMTPVRWIHTLIRYLMPRVGSPFQDNSLNKVHWIPDVMQKMARILVPGILTK